MSNELVDLISKHSTDENEDQRKSSKEYKVRSHKELPKTGHKSPHSVSKGMVLNTSADIVKAHKNDPLKTAEDRNEEGLRMTTDRSANMNVINDDDIYNIME